MITLKASRDIPIAVLAGVVEPVTIVDDQGEELGKFFPKDLLHGQELYDQARALLTNDPSEKIAPLPTNGKAHYTTKEVLLVLRSLTDQPATQQQLDELIHAQNHGQD